MESIKLKRLIIAGVGDNLEQLKLLYNADENIKQCSPFGKQCKSFLNN